MKDSPNCYLKTYGMSCVAVCAACGKVITGQIRFVNDDPHHQEGACNAPNASRKRAPARNTKPCA